MQGTKVDRPSDRGHDGSRIGHHLKVISTRAVIPDPHTIDPTTRALEAYIEASVEQLLRGPASPPQHGLLFLSAWHEAMPALVHLDPVLEPVDSRVFAVLWIWAKQQGRGTTGLPLL